MTEEDLPLDTARERLGDLLRTAAVGGLFRIENEHGEVAYLIGAAEFVELDDWAAIGRYETARRAGTLAPRVPMAEVREHFDSLLKQRHESLQSVDAGPQSCGDSVTFGRAELLRRTIRETYTRFEHSPEFDALDELVQAPQTSLTDPSGPART